MIRVRFAPSPTGYLHLGNVRTALFNYLFAKRNAGKFILRIEDTDRERSRNEYFKSQLEDLRWLGLVWDEGPEVEGTFGPYRQSERLDLYQKYVEKLIAEGKAYHCYVTEAETDEMKKLAQAEGRTLRFDNRGRFFSEKEISERKSKGIKPTVRFKIDNPKLSFTDMVRGEVTFNLDDMVGDFIIQRADGMPTFHLAVCIDDGLMQITHVIRGEDHLSNTPKHILLLEAMGFKPPQYGHLSLVNGPGGEPLSKRMESISVREFRRKGYLPHALANYISLLGWSPGGDREILTWEELQGLFDIGRVSKSSSNYDPQKLDWVNGQHCRALSEEVFIRKAEAYLKDHSMMNYDESLTRKVLPVFKDHIERFEQLPAHLSILAEDFPYEDAAMVRAETSREIYQAAVAILSELAETTEDIYGALIERLKARVSAKGKNLMMPLRMALTGKLHGPELKKLSQAFGVAMLKSRFERAIQQS